MKSSQGGALEVRVPGDPGVGKTSLVRRAAGDALEERYITTVGAEARTLPLGLTVPCSTREWLQKLVSWHVTGQIGRAHV
jgi:hypothetical protein